MKTEDLYEVIKNMSENVSLVKIAFFNLKMKN